MRLLLDTHALLWWWLNDARLPEAAQKEIRSAANVVLVSSATGWEIATKHRLGKLGLRQSTPSPPREAGEFDPREIPELLRRDRIEVLPVSLGHALEAGLLPGPHRDPFDRMLIAQSRVEDLPVVTGDPVFGEYGVSVIW